MTMKKRGLALFMTATMSLSAVSMTAFAADFNDMPNDWSKPALESAVSNGILIGDNGLIRPTDSLMRSEMATVINRAFNAQKTSSIGNFTDVKQGDWFYTEMSKAVAMKTFIGSGNKLNPNNNITREEVFVILARAFNIPKGSSNSLNQFTDQNNVSSWAREEAAALVSEGYIKGAEGRLNPKDEITRAEFAQMMSNLVKTYIKEGGLYSGNYTGNVMINKGGVLIDGSSIAGDLIIGDGVVNGKTVLENAKITGRLVVRSGDIDILGNSKIQDVIVSRVDGKTKVNAEAGTDIGKLTIEAHDDVTLEGDFDEVVLASSNITVNVEAANIGSLVVTGTGNKINADEDSTIDKIVANGKNLEINNNGSIDKITAATGATGVTINGNDVDPGTTVDGEVIDALVTYINNDGSKIEIDGKVYTVNNNTKLYNVDGVELLAVGNTDITPFLKPVNTIKVTDIVTNNDVIERFRLSEVVAPPVTDDVTLKVEDSDIVLNLDNTAKTINVEYNKTVGDLKAALATTDSKAVMKVLVGSAEVSDSVEVKTSTGITVKVTNEGKTANYVVTAQTGTTTGLSITDLNLARMGSSPHQIDLYKTGITAQELSSIIKLDDSQATFRVLTATGTTSPVAGPTDVLTSTNVVEVTSQTGVRQEYRLTTTNQTTLNTGIDLKEKDANKSLIDLSTHTITFKDTFGLSTKKVEDILAEVKPKASADTGLTTKMLTGTGGVEVAETATFVPGMVIEVTSQDANVVQEYTITSEALDLLDLADTALSSATYGLTVAADNTQALAESKVQGLVDASPTVAGKGITATVITTNHTPGVLNTTDGAYIFTVKLEKAGFTVTTSPITQTILK